MLEFFQMHFFLSPVIFIPLTERGFLVIGNWETGFTSKNGSDFFAFWSANAFLQKQVQLFSCPQGYLLLPFDCGTVFCGVGVSGGFVCLFVFQGSV